MLGRMSREQRPSYVGLYESGELARRAARARERLAECRLCPRDCGVDRTGGELGFCKTPERARVASWNLHFGEEAPLVGKGGSGTIFFGHCNLGCVFCQNFDISRPGAGMQEAGPEELAGVMLELAGQGAENINFVTPSHVVPQILEGLVAACGHGLELPLVYNSSAYDEVATLKLLDGVVDIYMPDAKFWDPEAAARYCEARDYPDKARAALQEMHRQVGDLVLDNDGAAVRGVLLRHLVMPDGLAGTGEWMRFVAQNLSKNTYVNVMDQYRPCGEARQYQEIARSPSRQRCDEARRMAIREGLTRLDERGDRGAWVLVERLKHLMGE
jgi:putative pyruvate formate lyase activating enzyme